MQLTWPSHSDARPAWDSPRAVWFQQFGSNSMLKVPPAQQFYWGNRAVPSLARVAERGGHHGAPPADEASSPSTRALIDRIGDPPHAAIEIALKLAGAEICPRAFLRRGPTPPLSGRQTGQTRCGHRKRQGQPLWEAPQAGSGE